MSYWCDLGFCKTKDSHKLFGKAADVDNQALEDVSLYLTENISFIIVTNMCGIVVVKYNKNSYSKKL